MIQKRQLAAIMFTDIEGYTAFMQGDESIALYLRDTHRRIFIAATEKYGGKILQYYGDGTLSIFDSAVAAVHCGIEMQLAFLESRNDQTELKEIPVRIGIHSGDIIYSEEDIIGDSVNVASRVESLASAGSVFISDKVYDEIKNQTSIQTTSMGRFEFKNVTKKIEVHAIANEGLVVPDRTNLSGKGRKMEKDLFFGSILNRTKPHLILGYLIGVWIVAQLTGWTMGRFQVSPHWKDIVMIFFLSMIPSLLVYLWNNSSPPGSVKARIRKYILPANIVISVILLFILFRGSELGATTQTVVFNDEEGIEQSRIILKPDFRRRLAIHNFIPEKPDSLHQWIRMGIHKGVCDDLIQNGLLTIGLWHDTESLQEMINLSEDDYYPNMLTGSYSVSGDIYEITTKLYRTKNGSLQESRTYRNDDLFAIIDSICMDTKLDLGLSQDQIDQFVDLPFEQAFTSNLDAYRNYAMFFEDNHFNHLELAVAHDSTFALAYSTMASFLYRQSLSKMGARDAIEKGMRFRKRLPEIYESELKLSYYQINDQPEKAIALLKMQLKLNPGDHNKIRALSNYLYLTERFEELLEAREMLAKLDPSPDVQIELAEALLLNEKFDEAGQVLLEALENYSDRLSAVSTLASYYALTAQMEEAETLLHDIIIQYPELDFLIQEYVKAFQYARAHPSNPENLMKYVGHYRIEGRAMEYDTRIIGNLLYGKGRSFMGGFFFIPCALDEFIMGSRHLYEKWTFLSDSSSRFYQIRTKRVESDKRVYHSVLWRQDSLINSAMKLLSESSKPSALDAFRIAYDHNPLHYYLAEYIRHLEYVLDPGYANELEKIKGFMGSYGPRNIWMEGGRIYYKRDGITSQRRLLPVAQDWFYFENGFKGYIQVIVENGQPTGTISWTYDHDLGEFVRNDNDFIEFDSVE